ncbi:hypothetical protein E2C01_052360 [Portunus trituberculatus]|uniref:Uncharacterized protein n=1 Tax=Portunus trituberculatus TaxID=210409 RepID=A0A5B7GMT1_PORTR|nr:hypothetical protein [Portunus trituberculatus]
MYGDEKITGQSLHYFNPPHKLSVLAAFLVKLSRGTVEPCVLWGQRGLQPHGFESCPRSECRLGFLTQGSGFLAGSNIGHGNTVETLKVRGRDESKTHIQEHFTPSPRLFLKATETISRAETLHSLTATVFKGHRDD